MQEKIVKEKASQEEIYRVMRSDIEAGGYPASSRLPSVRTLAKRFSASPNTISKVVSRLMESGLCTARRGVGLFVRSLPNRKLTLLVGTTSAEPKDDFYGHVEKRIAERCQADGIEIERYYITPGDPAYGPDVDRIRRPGRVILCIALAHEPHLKQLADLRRPMLVVGCAPSRCNTSSIVPNSFRSGYLAARHLIRKGCRRIAFIGRVREVRGVTLPEAESLKEFAGMQCAFMEDSLPLHPDLVFNDINQVAARAANLKDLPDAVIMPDIEGIESIQALKALGTKLERVVLGDDRILERPKRPAAVVVRREDVVELALIELHRLLDEQSKSHRSTVVDGELHDAVG
ncbi:MAG: GntR family transcriptional regulator [Planctomycetes bacterium]|nr:GntR family transcriptional regulator [Planctomycetota bacterium]